MNHDGGSDAYLPVEVVATWPKGSFAESIAVDDEGTIFVTLHTDQKIVKVDPASGTVTPFVMLDRPATGLVFAADGALIVSGGAPGTAPGVVWRIERDGSVKQLAEIADAAFLNGMTPLGDRMLIAESIGAKVYAIDPVTGQVETWLHDPLLAAPEGADGPGANGIKLYGGAALISVTGADRIVRVPIGNGKAGAPEVLAEAIRVDDFAIAADGTFYLATHQAQSLVRLAPDGRRTTLARAEHGLVGSTAVAFGRGAGDSTAIYITTTGGTWTVPEDRMEEAKLLRIEVGQLGNSLLGDA